MDDLGLIQICESERIVCEWRIYQTQYFLLGRCRCREPKGRTRRPEQVALSANEDESKYVGPRGLSGGNVIDTYSATNGDLAALGVSSRHSIAPTRK